jgi:hypothetical protein
MAIDQSRPLQFNLRSVFGLMAAVGWLLWLSRGSTEIVPIVPSYLFLGLAQVVLAWVVWKHLVRLGWRLDLERQACETAIIAGGLTLGPWALLIVSLTLMRLGIVGLMPEKVTIVLFAAGLILAAVMHVLGLTVNLLNFVLALGALRHLSVLGLTLLNAANTALPIFLLWWALAHGWPD